MENRLHPGPLLCKRVRCKRSDHFDSFHFSPNCIRFVNQKLFSSSKEFVLKSESRKVKVHESDCDNCQPPSNSSNTNPASWRNLGSDHRNPDTTTTTTTRTTHQTTQQQQQHKFQEGSEQLRLVPVNQSIYEPRPNDNTRKLKQRQSRKRLVSSLILSSAPFDCSSKLFSDVARSLSSLSCDIQGPGTCFTASKPAEFTALMASDKMWILKDVSFD